MNDRRSELRRLRGMQSEICALLMLIVAALIIDNHTFTFITLLVNAFLWTLMMQETGRDIRALRVHVPDGKTPSKGVHYENLSRAEHGPKPRKQGGTAPPA